MAVDQFIRRFRNVNRIKAIDGWKDISAYPFEGGCSDFALTVLKLVEGSWLKVLWAILTFKAVFWFVRSPTNKWWWPRHVALWHRTYGWIDSTERVWRNSAKPHVRILPLPFFWTYFRILWGVLWVWTLGRIWK